MTQATRATNGFPTTGTGIIKNIKIKTDSIVTANISLRGDDGKCITTMPLVFIDKPIQTELEGKEIAFDGRIVTRFDRRPGIENASRYKPYTQIAVDMYEVLA
jgi:hypothetical protein